MRLQADLRKEPHKIGIGSIVMYEKPGIEGERRLPVLPFVVLRSLRKAVVRRSRQQDRMRVAAQTRLLLEQPHPVTAAEEICGGQAGDTGAHNRNAFHPVPVPSSRCISPERGARVPDTLPRRGPRRSPSRRRAGDTGSV